MIRPETIALTLASSPPGATLSYSARGYLAPATVTSAIGYRTSVVRAGDADRGGATYVFDSWSDGGERSHQFVIPGDDTTLTAALSRRSRAARGPARPGRRGPRHADAWPDACRSRGARLRVATPARRARALAGTVSGVAARPRVLVALRTVRSGGRCRRWSAARGRLAGLSRACASGHTWMRAAVTKTGASAWRFKARLRGTPRAGRYVVTTRVTDRRGRTVIGAKSAPIRLR